MSVIKRRFPAVGVAIVVNALEPEVMLEAMRAGVTEVLYGPIGPDIPRELAAFAEAARR